MAELNRPTMWVLLSHEHDGSGEADCHRVYALQSEGLEDLKLASSASHKAWLLLEVPVYGRVAGLTADRLLEIAAIPDEDIDTSDIPELGAAFFSEGKWQRLKPAEVNGRGNLCRMCKHRDFGETAMSPICAFNPLITRTAARKVCQGKLWEPEEAVE